MSINREYVDGLEVLSMRPHKDHDRPHVLFVHGAGCGAWIWENWLPLFAEHGYPSYALSLRGHGGSAGSYRGARLADYVDDLRRMVPPFEQPPVLAGQSMGARASQLLVVDAP